MSYSKFLPIALFIGFQAFAIQIVDQLLSPMMPPLGNVGFGWIAFQAWAMYFLAGCNVKDGVRSFMGYGLGVLASIAIMTMGGSFAGLGFWAMPLVLMILVPVVISFEQAPSMINFVPAIFVGAGVFFAFMSYIPGATFATAALTEMTYCVIGLIFGYVTVATRGWYENSIKTSSPGKIN